MSMGSREEDITFMNGSSILLSLHTHTQTQSKQNKKPQSVTSLVSDWFWCVLNLLNMLSVTASTYISVCLFWLSGTHISWIWAHLHKSLWPLEWGRIDAVLILHLYLKRPCRFLLNLLCFCNCHKTNVMGISVGGSSPANMPQPSEAWSRASAELQEQEKASLDQWD